MVIVRGDLFKQKADAICISTNGFYTYQNAAVMGRGVALQASKKWPVLRKRLGYMLQMHGTHVFLLSRKKRLGGDKLDYHVINFPVKARFGTSEKMNVVRHLRDKFPEGSWVPGWALKADVNLIKQSAKELLALTNARGWKRVVLPLVGCGAGELEWKRVQKVLARILKGNRFVFVEVE